MEKNKILNIMVAQHGLIEALFLAFKDEVKVHQERAKIFLSEFSWEIKKHFFIEEAAIFGFSLAGNSEITEIISRLKYEHVLMADQLNKMIKGISEINNGQTEEFLKLLTSHREAEEQKLYPHLDEKLSDEQKMLIISRINEIPVNKFK